tara:strand:- start:1222 stop:1464 length:243 start_codon:yes stop_codon:yes gene_type:complete
MSEEAARLAEKLLPVSAMDERTVLFQQCGGLGDKLKAIANCDGQPVTLELNEIGDRKKVGGMVYQLDEAGWRRLPIGTEL